MKVFILYAKESSETGPEMVEALKASLGDGTDVSVGGGKELNDKVDILIRWGSQKKVPLKPGKVINTVTSIYKASNKCNALDIMKQDGINVPTMFTKNDSTVQFPCLGRKIHHIGGTDIVLCMQMADYIRAHDECEFWTKYIPTLAEYRVHVLKGEVIKISQKILTKPEECKNVWIRNFDNGWTFMVPKDKPKKSAIGMAVDAVEALGLHFGAVDLIVSDTGMPYVLEVNTAPGCKADSTLEAYIAKFKAEILSNA